MRKIISLLLILLPIFTIVNHVIASWSVTISAIVGNINHAPVIISISPNWNPEALPTSTLQGFSIVVKDDEKDTITYTYTPQDGSTNPINWTINTWDYNWSNEATINFDYLSPSTWVWTTKVTVTINDWSNVIYQDINLFIY